jgi:lysozyme
VGYGHTSAAGHPKVVKGMKLTTRECEEILIRDLGKYEADVSRFVKVPLTQNQFDCLVSFHYNTGALGKSTLLRKVNAGRFHDVPAELRKWTRGGGQVLKGLVNRREAEIALWNAPTVKPQAEVHVTPAPVATSVDLPAPERIAEIKERSQEIIATPAPEVAKPSVWARLSAWFRG